ncbi:PREDICTED: uncharacterized protein LOC105450348 [Wasmannia auropunctata]|uniref:uncharacterized protein LOC105450348 n=1 Tax=Wasmannia auropunctata TaxID=64793 RepID=UPI0005EFD7B8|nr:PREDICTED: uncharacterized protein LOC105450348 [Wasmannia auropunctata]
MSKKKSLEKQKLIEELHAPARRNFPRRRVIVCGYDDLWQADVVEMRPYTRFNRGYHYILTVIDVLSDRLKNGLYQVKLKTEQNENSFLSEETTDLTEDTCDDAQLWHRRLGHTGYKSMKTLMKISSGIDIPVSQINKMDKVCKICMEAKQTRSKFDTTRVKAKKPLELIHTDLCGPIDPDWDGHKYFITLLDDYTHFTIVYLLKTKNEAIDKIKEYVNKVEAKRNAKVAKLRCDNGREFINNVMTLWCKSKGIEMDTTVPHTPQLNGKAERLNRTLMDKEAVTDEDSERWTEVINEEKNSFKENKVWEVLDEIQLKGEKPLHSKWLTSDIGSEIEENQLSLKRKKKCPRRHQSSSEEEEENNNCLQTKKSSSAILSRPPPVQSQILPRHPSMQSQILSHHPPMQSPVQRNVFDSGESLGRNLFGEAENNCDDTTEARSTSTPRRLLSELNHRDNYDNRTGIPSRSHSESRYHDNSCFETEDVLTNETSSTNYRTLLKLITYVKRQNDQILKQNEEIIKSLKNKAVLESAIHELPELPVSLPIKSLEDVIRIEEHLINDDNLSTLSLYLSTLGGRDLTTKTNTILRNILSNEVAIKYSFLGTRNEKKSFSASRLHRLIIRAVQFSSPNTPESNINDIKIWLKHSPQRLALERKRNAR